MKYHEIKTWPVAFDSIDTGDKTFEFRKNDRGFEVGDAVLLREWDQFSTVDSTGYTGREIPVVITYILQNAFDVPAGYCVFSFTKIDRKPLIPIKRHDFHVAMETLRSIVKRSPFNRFYLIQSGSQYIIDTSNKINIGQNIIAHAMNDQITIYDNHEKTTTSKNI